jgi:hypothetical protein
MRVSFQELCDAFEFVSLDGGYEHQAFICKQSGKIYCYSENLEEDLEELPEGLLEDEEKYLPIPSRQDLGLGKQVALDFAHQFLPNDAAEVHRIFSRKGAYARFKHLLTRKAAIDRWYEFEDKATKRELRDWCEVNSIELVD